MTWLAVWIVVFAACAVGVAVSASSARFRWNVAREVQTPCGIQRASSHPTRDVAALPRPVQRYLEAAVGDDATSVAMVRLRHGGTFRMAPGQRWREIRGEQFFNTNPPSFVWCGRARVAPGLWIEARDESVRGVGSILVKAGASWTVADASGRLMSKMLPW